MAKPLLLIDAPSVTDDIAVWQAFVDRLRAESQDHDVGYMLEYALGIIDALESSDSE
jgi:hypothetical protein